MTRIELNNIVIHTDIEANQLFYSSQPSFTCKCPDCKNYVEKMNIVRTQMNGLDEKLGIDLTKDVGQGVDELMFHRYNDHCLYVAPYYIIGKCYINDQLLKAQSSGPILSNTICAQHSISDSISLTIINSANCIELADAEVVLTIWIEFKTESSES